MAPKNGTRELVRIGLPATAHQVYATLDAFVYETDRRDVIVRHYNGALIVEAPEPTLPEPGDPEPATDVVAGYDDERGRYEAQGAAADAAAAQEAEDRARSEVGA